jgi:hypothetical protein
LPWYCCGGKLVFHYSRVNGMDQRQDIIAAERRRTGKTATVRPQRCQCIERRAFDNLSVCAADPEDVNLLRNPNYALRSAASAIAVRLR